MLVLLLLLVLVLVLVLVLGAHLTCFAADGGGIADKPGNVVDVYHTFFGVAGI